MKILSNHDNTSTTESRDSYSCLRWKTVFYIPFDLFYRLQGSSWIFHKTLMKNCTHMPKSRMNKGKRSFFLCLSVRIWWTNTSVEFTPKVYIFRLQVNAKWIKKFCSVVFPIYINLFHDGDNSKHLVFVLGVFTYDPVVSK